MLVSAREAAEILDMEVHSIYMAGSQGTLRRHAQTHARMQYDLDEIEALSLRRIRYMRAGHPYWLTVPEAAKMLGVTRDMCAN